MPRVFRQRLGFSLAEIAVRRAPHSTDLITARHPLNWIAATDDKRLVSKSSPQITSKTVTSSEAKRRVKRDVFQRAFGGVSSTQRDGPPHQLSGGDGTHV